MTNDEIDQRTDEDMALAMKIMGVDDPEAIARLVFEYYHDNGRAERTPRSTMYLHLGLLTGAVMRALERRPATNVSWGDKREKSE